jgi:Ni/Co efflux regulator RcnB
MKSTFIGLAAAALLGMAGVAAAHDGRDYGRDYGRSEGRGYDYARVAQDWRYERYERAPAYAVRSWQRGDRLPSAYWSRGYVVDYPRYRLYAPPRGARWVRVDNDVLLTALATGLVLDVIHNLGR